MPSSFRSLIITGVAVIQKKKRAKRSQYLYIYIYVPRFQSNRKSDTIQRKRFDWDERERAEIERGATFSRGECRVFDRAPMILLRSGDTTKTDELLIID